jgi:hypothetical protein
MMSMSHHVKGHGEVSVLSSIEYRWGYVHISIALTFVARFNVAFCILLHGGLIISCMQYFTPQGFPS